MTILIYFIILIAFLFVFLKLKERSKVSMIVNSKTGKVIPYLTIFESIVGLIKRFVSGIDSVTAVMNNASLKGRLFISFFLGKPIVMVTDPTDIREILSMKNFSKPEQGGSFSPLIQRYLSDSLLILNDEPWVKQRKAINTAMSYSKIKEFIPVFSKISNVLVNKIKEKGGEYVEINNEFTLMTFDVIGKAGFGFDFKSLEGSQNIYLSNMKFVLENFIHLPTILFKSLYDNLPIKRNIELKRSCNEVDEWIHQIIVERRKQNEIGEEKTNKEKDLLDLILEAEKEENLNLTSKELHNNIFLFFFAGHDTSSSALTSVLYFLAKYPEYIDQAKKEVAQEIGDEENFSFDTIQRLSLCNAIIKESLRLLPPVTGVTGRIANKDLEIGGYSIPKGCSISCQTFMSHFDEKYWENPNEFNPKRFLDEKSKESQKNAYFPFGYGPRRCPGDKFALAEICVTLVAFLQNFKRWEFKEGFKYVRDGLALTTRPKDGLPLKFFI